MYKNIGKRKQSTMKYIFIVNLVIVVFALCFLFTQTNIDGYFNTNEHEIEIIKDNVVIINETNDAELVDLPVRRNANQIYSYTFIPKALKTGEDLFLYVKADYVLFDLISDSKVIYESGMQKSKYTKTGGHLIKLFKIDEKYLNKEINIRFKSNYPSDSGVIIPSIVLGSESVLLLYLIKSDIPNILMFSLLFISGFILLVASIILVFIKKASTNFLSLGILSIITSFYVAINIPFFIMIIDLPDFLYIADYLIFDICPAFVLVILIANFKRVKDIIWQRIVLKVLLVITSLNAIIQFTLQVTGYIEYLDFRTSTLYFIMFSFLLFTLLPLTLNGNKYKFKKSVLISTLPLTISLLFSSLLYILKAEIRFITILSLTVCSFLVMQFISLFREYIKTYAEERTVNLYKKLALIDSLTSLSTRNAFETEIEKIKLDNSSSDNVLFIFIDVNNLKYINDTFSHKAGDILIRAMGEIIASLEIKFSDTRGYRYGGDEFIIISREADIEKATAILDTLNLEAEEYKIKNNDVPLSFSLGYSIEKISSDFDVEELIVNADRKMYQHKHEEKGL